MLSNEAIAIQSLFHIQSKEGVGVPYILNHAQQTLDGVDKPDGRTRLIVAKARQKGFSSAMLAKFAIRCLGKEGTHAVVISHESSATQRLLDRVDYYLKHINGPPPSYGLNSRKEMSFPIRDSTYYIGTAGSRAFGRGDWITDLHCSEYAWWEHPTKHAAGLFQAVPYGGRIYIESTGNGKHNDFYYIWEHAEQMDYKRLFYPWFADNEYELPPFSSDGVWRPDCPRHTPYLLDLRSKFKLSDRKMAWYELKLKEMREDLQLMQQEYPSTPDECFQATGGSIFPDVETSFNAQWQSKNWEGYYVYVLEGHPVPNFHYALGADPSGGTGHDDAAFVVFCIETGEQVFEFHYNTVDPIKFAKLICSVGRHYDEAFIACESNNHGAAVIPYLKENYPKHRLYKRKFATKTTPALYGWQNATTNKHALVGLMQEELNQATFYGTQTVKELSAFEETEEGKMEGDSDNLVIAVGLAMLGLRKFAYLRREYNAPKVVTKKEKPNYMAYTLEEVLANIERRRRALGSYGDQAGPRYPMA